MTNLQSIPGIGKSSLELLEAAGFANAESLAKAGVDELVKELERANQILRIAERAPGRKDIDQWISTARTLTGVEEETVPEMVMPVDYEKSPQAASMLAGAPFAIPLPAKVLVEQKLGVADIPPGILLNRYSGDLEIRVEDRVPASRNPKPPVPVSSNVMISDPGPSRIEIDTARIKSIDVLSGPAPRTGTTKKLAQDDDRVALIRAPRVETNRGKDPSSRRYIRGVLHSHPISLSIGAILTLVLTLLLPAGIVSAGLLLLSDLMPQHFQWVPKWLLVFPLCLPVVGIAWMIWGMNGSCRICGQRLFVPRMCLKNSKAHHVPGLGYILPVSFHMLVFRWFRCTYCGTPVRLKK
ncbi:DUF4332 domain-containing protein [Luteolibacter yonseiensis]|uniref:DUF4332 domain-containing protein n=1 Tax=Luteolibacter yonseiensis TaxID=1144680 RepID=A0A934R6J2_9BACT|nr:DUF4332 domain-containing protein [Luteolibacter yonseiensis]MBK1818186.1 DUF4332 domain-containing protein [Luteolibacter yonseiensis]